MHINDMRNMARHIVESFGGEPRVHNYLDVDESSSIEILTSQNGVYPNTVSASTLGLAAESIGKSIGDKELRIEISGIGYSEYSYIPNMVSTSAFNIINTNIRTELYSVHKNVVYEYYRDFDIKHVFFVTPFIWESLTNIELDNKIITWLLMVPISDKEFEFYCDFGGEALNELFVSADIDVFDLERKSIL